MNPSKPLRLLGTLSFRIYLVCFLFLVVPLFLHSIFLYEKEYRQKVREAFLNLYVVGESRIAFIDKQIEVEKLLLEWIATALKLIPPSGAIEDFLQGWATKGRFPEVFYFSATKEQKFTCLFPKGIPPEECPFGFLENLEKSSKGIFLSEDGELFLRVPIPGETAAKGESFLVSKMPVGDFVQHFYGFDEVLDFLDFSLVKENKIVVSSEDDFLDRRISEEPGALHLVPQEIEKETFLLTDGADKSYAVKLPIKDLKASLLVTVSKSHISSMQQKLYLFRSLSLFLFVLILGGGASFLLIHRISFPLQALYGAMKKVSSGDLTARFIKDKMGFEINLLGGFFNQMIDSIIRNQKEVEKQKLQRLKFSQELHIGREIQKSMFPSKVPEFPGLEISPGYVPAKEVSGDFYDLFLKEEESLVLSIADTSGKGISACLYSLSVRSLLRSFTSLFPSLEEAIRKTNELFCKDVGDRGIFVTAWVGIYEKKSRKISYTNCGHYAGMLKKKDNSFLELGTRGMALGASLDFDVMVKEIYLEKGDLLLLYTDGVVEAEDRKGRFYGKDRLRKFFLDLPLEISAKHISESLLREVQLFTEGAPPHDDLTILAFRVVE